jgi:hypothetical protein
VDQVTQVQTETVYNRLRHGIGRELEIDNTGVFNSVPPRVRIGNLSLTMIRYIARVIYRIEIVVHRT